MTPGVLDPPFLTAGRPSDRLRRQGTAIWRFVRRKPLGAFGAFLLLLMLVAAAGADLIAPYDPLALNPQDRLEGPSFTHLMGTDNLGRDMFSRIIHGARPSLYTGLLVVAFSVILGTFLGVTSAYFGGVYDLLVQRLVDGLMAMPGLVFAMAILAMFSSGIHIWKLNLPLVWHTIPLAVVFTISVLGSPTMTRVVRAAALGITNSDYMLAARALGGGSARLMLRHLLPNVIPPIIVIATAQLGAVILIEASLSFLGLGLPPPSPSWGAMLQGDGRRYMEVAPWLAIFPGAAISVGVLGFNLFGDALRDVLDPRLRGGTPAR